ncbi:MAG: DNA cytosine methyltransferase [Ferrovibrio sp.]|nr:DNA cytosine methyltransferase [Ferrovibrio sp.]
MPFERRKINHAHMCCGVGAGATGFLRGKARVGNMEAESVCLGGIDNDKGALEGFEAMTGVKGTLLDLFSTEQYIAFHGRLPPTGWREAVPADLHRAYGHQHPHVVFMSFPCKGNSGLLPENRAKTSKYQALNELALRGVWLLLEAYKDDPIEFILFENVPRIVTRSRKLLDKITALLHSHGYAVHESNHCCGELGGLAQRRKRFLLVARHMAKVPPFLYQAPRKPLKSVGSVLEQLPLPGDPAAGPMHRVPSLHWKTWVRLAFVEAGKDWRSLKRLAIEDGHLRDYLILPDEAYHRGVLGVNEWEGQSGVVTTRGLPYNGAFSVADPRADEFRGEFSQLGLKRWRDVGSTVTSAVAPGQGPYSEAEPRIGSDQKHNNAFRVVRMEDVSPTITSGAGPSAGGLGVADPRPTALSSPDRNAYLTGGHYGVVPWTGHAGAVPAQGQHDNGPWSVADPRATWAGLPGQNDKVVAVIRAEDGTWHRPFTTLDQGALQSMVDFDKPFWLAGNSDSAWREWIGNAVPPDAAEAVASTIFKTLLLVWTGQTFLLTNEDIWVRPYQIAVSLPPLYGAAE